MFERGFTRGIQCVYLRRTLLPKPILFFVGNKDTRSGESTLSLHDMGGGCVVSKLIGRRHHFVGLLALWKRT